MYSVRRRLISTEFKGISFKLYS